MGLTIPITLSVINPATSTGIAGANVFVNGVFITETDTNGNASFTIQAIPSNPLMQITATGFQSTSQSINTDSINQSLQVSLTPNPIQSAIISFQFVPAQAGIVWQLTQGVNTITNGVSAPDGSSQTVDTVPYGAYTVAAQFVGYQNLNQTITINGQQSPYVLTLIANSNPSSAQTGSTTGTSSPLNGPPSNIISQVTTTPPVSSEYIYPNSDYDKYFTIIGARMYIGNLFIDELNSVQWALQDNAIPIYGYPSRYVDAYGQGRSLVQGQLTLNFVTEGYLYTVMQQYQQYIANANSTASAAAPGAQTVTQVLGMIASRNTLLQQVNNTAPGNTSAATNASTAQAAQLQTQIMSMVNGMTYNQVNSLNSQLTQQKTTFTGPIAFDNAIYQDVLFDIRVEMGNEVTGVRRIRYLEKCKLISNEMVIAPDGQTLLDSYGFIARRLR